MQRRLSRPRALLVFLLTAACHPSPPAGDPSRAAEGWDTANRPQLLGLRALTYEALAQSDATRGAMPRKPWKDSYWPYHRKNIAYRYGASQDFLTFADQSLDAQTHPENPYLSPAEKYDLVTEDAGFRLTAESWATYDYYKAKYGDDLGQWAWMGICAGWAPASLNETAPQNAVLAINGQGRETLFFAGDIRGLLSKAYDINATEKGYRVVGSRCNEPEYAVPRDRSGRAVDGRLSATLEPFVILSDASRVNGALEVAQDPLAPRSYWLLAPEPLRTLAGPARFWRYASREDLARDLEAGARGAHAVSPELVDAQLFKSCRDVNPAALHTALVQMVSDAAPTKVGFVVEISRDREIWNHPIWAFTSTVGPLRPVHADRPEARAFRAPGTTHVVHVATQLVYASGAQAATSYPGDHGAAFDWRQFAARPWTYALLDLGYTLEIDESGLVIGGEWDEDPRVRLALPDFFWRTLGGVTDRRKDGAESPLKYSVVRQLAECSRRNADTTRDIAGPDGTAQTVDVVRCPL